MENIELFKYCADNPEMPLDKNYMFIEKHSNINFYIKKTKEIKDILINIKKAKDDSNNEKVLDLLRELQKAIKNNANYSEFGCFVNACDTNISQAQKDIKILEKIAFFYVEKRNLDGIVNEEWIQAVVDKGSSRKKGVAGQEKLMKILEEKGYKRIDKICKMEEQEKCFALFSKKSDFSNENIKEKLGVFIGEGTQNKVLDLLIKKGQDIFFLEAKHLSTSGGEQNKQVEELINIIKKENKKEEYHFVAFLDGLYSNGLLLGENAEKDEKKNKIVKQHKDILEVLKTQKSNYWVDTAGFIKLFS